jgi:Tfp pilus assembly protein PilF
MGTDEMSVINTMLKDLEQRGGKRDQSKEEILQGLSSSASGIMRKREFSPYLISLFSVLGVCVILLLLYLYSPYQLVATRQAASPQPVAVAQPPVPPVTSPATVVAPASPIVTENDAAVAERTAVIEKPATPPLQVSDAAAAVPAKPSTEPKDAIAQSGAAGKEVTASNGKLNKTRQAKPVTSDQADAVNQRSAVQLATSQESETEADISKTKREPSDAEKSVNAYVLAMDMFSQGRTDESRLQLKQALALDPANSKAGQLLAAIYLGDDRAELAMDVLDRSLKLRPADQDLLRLYLKVQVQMKNYAQAIDIMEHRMRLSTPEDVAYLAGLHQKNNDHLGAARLYAQALKLKPSNSVWWMGQGISFEALGMNEEAMKSYRQSIEAGRLNTQLAEYVLGRIASIEKSIKAPVS